MSSGGWNDACCLGMRPACENVYNISYDHGQVLRERDVGSTHR